MKKINLAKLLEEDTKLPEPLQDDLDESVIPDDGPDTIVEEKSTYVVEGDIEIDLTPEREHQLLRYTESSLEALDIYGIEGVMTKTKRAITSLIEIVRKYDYLCKKYTDGIANMKDRHQYIPESTGYITSIKDTLKRYSVYQNVGIKLLDELSRIATSQDLKNAWKDNDPYNGGKFVNSVIKELQPILGSVVDLENGSRQLHIVKNYIEDISKETLCRTAGILSFNDVNNLCKAVISSCSALFYNGKFSKYYKINLMVEDAQDEDEKSLERNCKRYIYLTDILLMINEACRIDVKFSVKTIKNIFYELEDSGTSFEENLQYLRSIYNDSSVIIGNENFTKVFDKIKNSFKSIFSSIEETNELYMEFINKYSKEVDINEILNSTKVTNFTKKDAIYYYTNATNLQVQCYGYLDKALKAKSVSEIYKYPAIKHYNIPELDNIKNTYKSKFKATIDFVGTADDFIFDAVHYNCDELNDKLKNLGDNTAADLGYKSLKDIQDVVKLINYYYKKYPYNDYLKLWGKLDNLPKYSSESPDTSEVQMYNVNRNRVFMILVSILITRGVFLMNVAEKFNSMLKQIKSKI